MCLTHTYTYKIHVHFPYISMYVYMCRIWKEKAHTAKNEQKPQISTWQWSIYHMAKEYTERCSIQSSGKRTVKPVTPPRMATQRPQRHALAGPGSGGSSPRIRGGADSVLVGWVFSADQVPTLNPRLPAPGSPPGARTPARTPQTPVPRVTAGGTHTRRAGGGSELRRQVPS